MVQRQGVLAGGAPSRAVTPPKEEVPWRAVLVPFVVSRIFSDALLCVMARVRGRDVILGGFRRWDGRWYSWIAAHGYNAIPHAQHHQTPWPFFPLLPAAMRGVSGFGVSIPVAGVLVNHIAFFVALVGIQRIAARHTSARGASIAVWVTALGPFAFVFSMVYPSALFLAASVWAFVFVEDDRDLAAGAAAAIAVLARPNGLIVVVVLVFVVRHEWRRIVRVAGPAAVGFLAWMAYNGARTGDVTRFLDAKRAWREVDVGALLRHPTTNPTFHLVVAGVAFGLVYAARRAIPRSWTWFTGLYLAPSLLLGIVGMGRYATDTFPPMVSAGVLLAHRTRRTITTILVALAAAQVICAFFYIARPSVI
jgi:hypothetical protein